MTCYQITSYNIRSNYMNVFLKALKGKRFFGKWILIPPYSISILNTAIFYTHGIKMLIFFSLNIM